MGFKIGNSCVAAAISIHFIYIRITISFAQIKDGFIIICQNRIAIFACKLGELFMRARYCIIHPNIPGNGAAVVFTPNIFATFFILIINLFAIGAHFHFFCWCSKYLVNASAICSNAVQFRHAASGKLSVCRCIQTGCTKQYRFTIG